jgi:hypothetical protein
MMTALKFVNSPFSDHLKHDQTDLTHERSNILPEAVNEKDAVLLEPFVTVL